MTLINGSRTDASRRVGRARGRHGRTKPEIRARLDGRPHLDRLLHGDARRARRGHRAPLDPSLARRRHRDPPMDGDRLQHRLRWRDTDRRRVGRSLRAQTRLPDRPRALHHGFGRLCHGAERRDPGLLPHLPGHGGRDRDATQSHAAHFGVPGRQTRCHRRHLGWHRRPRRGERSPHRRSRSPRASTGTGSSG